MTAPPPLTGDQLSDLLRLTKVADSVELKAGVPDSAQRPPLRALDFFLQRLLEGAPS
jgi:hypothetical protein